MFGGYADLEEVLETHQEDNTPSQEEVDEGSCV
jgi:hypothetical protein